MKVAFWGHFGTLNLGNECTLHAILQSARRHVPHAQFLSVCSQPIDTAHRHGIEAVPMGIDTRAGLMVASQPRSRSRFARLAAELVDCVRAIRLMKDVDVLIIAGTGVLADTYEGTFGIPFQLFKWALAGRLRGKRVAFISIGAEGLHSPLKRKLMGLALGFASYRSYRDEISRQRAKGLLASARHDPIFPDLAFSLPSSLLPERNAPGAGALTVAVGLYTVDGGAEALGRYADVIGRFVAWLLAKGHRVRLVIGDAEYDPPAMSAVRAWLADKGLLEQVQADLAESFEMLLGQLGEADLVVATRFHNVLLSLLLVKPVLSISHMDKNDQLMNSMGLSRFCVPLEGAQLEQITNGFEDLQRDATRIRESIRTQSKANRALLEDQYSQLFGGAPGEAGSR